MTRRLAVFIVAVAVGTVATGFAQAPAAPGARPTVDRWLARGPAGSFLTFKMADPGFRIDYPKKDWLLLPGGGSVVMTAASKKGDAAVVIERATLNQPLGPADVTDLFAQLETDVVKERHPKAADFQSRVLESGDRRLVAIEFTRPGVTGVERVRQYTIPDGKELYRVICVSPARQFAAYDAMFSHMAASFALARATE